MGASRTACRLVAVALLVAACAGGTPSGTHRPTDGAAAVDPPPIDETKPALQADGPLRGLILATDLTADGTIVEQRLGFTSNDTIATAIVKLGADAPEASTLLVSWYRLTGVEAGRDLLFTHEIAVGPNGLAFSEGVAEPGLAPGLYETVATMGGRQVRAPWVVSRGADGSAAAQAARAAIAATTAVDAPAPEEPGSGDAGYVANGEFPPTGLPSTTCTVDRIYASTFLLDVDVAAWGVGPCTDLTLTAASSGAPVTVASVSGIDDASTALEGKTVLCIGLPGSTDLPGGSIHLEVSGSASAVETYVLPDFGEGLQAGVESVPARGSIVKPGDVIQLHALAALFPPADGVKVLYLDDGTDLIESVGNLAGSDEPVPCDVGRLYARLVTEYEVPSDPPPNVEICATTEGFDGTQKRDCISFPTETIRLDGVWDDNGRLVTIAQTGTVVTGTFVGDYYCDIDSGSLRGEETPQPGANIQTTTEDFSGTLSGSEDVLPGDTITGEIVTCRWGGGAPGIARVRLELKVEDANTLTGEYISDIDYDQDGEIDRGGITMIRQP